MCGVTICYLSHRKVRMLPGSQRRVFVKSGSVEAGKADRDRLQEFDRLAIFWVDTSLDQSHFPFHFKTLQVCFIEFC